MAYDREAAFKEAQTTWNTPCRDGTISRIGGAPLIVENERRKLGLGPNWQAKFIWNFNRELEAACFVNGTDTRMFHGWDGLGDCAHFMSKCLQAGGAKIATDFVPTLESSLRALPNTKTLAVKVTADRAERIIQATIGSGTLFKKGDVVLYYDPMGTKIQGFGPIYHHSALYVGQVDNSSKLEGTIACHTRSRFMEPWLIFGPLDTDRYTLIHFGDDDLPNAGLASTLAGWWEVNWQGKNYYYFYEANGKVSWRTLRPPSTQQRMMGAEGTGYWFSRGFNSFLICWTQSGSIEEFTITLTGTQTGKWNGATPLSATKL